MARHLLFFLILLLLPVAHAVGFMNLPVQREYIFEPGLSFDVPISVVNNGNTHVALTTITPGHPETLGTPEDDNILSYVELEDPDPDGANRQVVMHFRLPEQLKPGFYYVDIVATDLPEGPGATVSAVAATKLRITVRALSPEKVVEVTGIEVPPIAEGLNANTTVYFVSRTTQRIDNVYVQAQVYRGDELVADGLSPGMALESAQAGSLTVPLKTAELVGGEYRVQATVFYDGKSTQASTEVLKIGTLHVAVPEHTAELQYNTTNRFMFNISNQWNQELQDVYATVLFGPQSKKTASQNIAPFGKTQYEIYFDRQEDILPGDTQVNITVSYKDFDPRAKKYIAKEESMLVPVKVLAPPVEEGLSGAMIAMYSFMGLLALLVIVALILLFRRKSAPPASPPPVNP
jgi:hypothetical protein